MKFCTLLLLSFLLLVFGCQADQPTKNTSSEVKPVKTLELSKYSDASPPDPLNLLFIHHSCGGNWLADKGPSDCKDCICKTHPNGGGLRRLLAQNNYKVHEASYKSIIGDKTDLLDWPPKFRDQMDRILRTRMQDELLPEGEKNQIVMFKSCFPNNNFPDDASVHHAMDAYKSLLTIFEKHPDTLFVAVTAPPLVKPCSHSVKGPIKKILGKCRGLDGIGYRAREFNNWLKDIESGWLSKYNLNNAVVFDLYDILTKEGQSNWAGYPTRDGRDSHPSSEGNSIAAKRFVPFLNRAVHRAGLAVDQQ